MSATAQKKSEPTKKNPPGILDWIVDPVKGLFSGLWKGVVGLSGGEVRGKSPQVAIVSRGAMPEDQVPWPASIIAQGLAGAFKYDEFGPDTLVEKAKVAVGTSSPEWKKEMEAGMTEFSKRMDEQYLKKLIMPPKGSSPITMDEAMKWGTGIVSTSIGMATAIWLAHMVAEAGSLGQLEGVNELYHNIMTATGLAAISATFLRVPVDVGILTPTRQFYLNTFKPNIPPGPDLVTMVVREAFDPKMVIKAPEEFVKWMGYAGYSQEWCDRYWTMHFIPIALRQGYENLWRGYWDKEKFMHMLHIADIHPMWREDIYKVAFGPPGVRELGYGYDTGLYTVEDIVKYRRWGGLSSEDAEKAGKAMVAYRTEAEREALRREALADYEAGLDDEAQLRANLKAIGGRPEIIDLWVERAKFRATRDLTLDLVKSATNDFIKGWTTENEFRQDLITLGVVPERREAILKDALGRRKGKKLEEDSEKHKLLTVADARKARELGLIGDQEFVNRMIAANYHADDARLLLAIELTPRPVTPEEVERRQRTVTSKLNRARRRWEDRLARAANQIELTELQRDDASTVMAESLDVIDAQIKIAVDTIPVVTPEKAAELEKKVDLLVQRRELTEARFTAQIRKLTEQHTDLTEQRALMERHRDEELAEYEEELKLIGGVAG